jgi:hypothetical protein
MRKEILKKLLFSKYSMGVLFGMYSFAAFKWSKNMVNTGDSLENQTHRPLEKAEANRRADHLSDISYRLILNLSKPQAKTQDFSGKIFIEFTATQVEDLFLDFSGKVETMEINNKACLRKDFEQVANRIFIGDKNLVRGKNVIVIKFNSNYSANSGLVYMNFKDEEKVFLSFYVF